MTNVTTYPRIAAAVAAVSLAGLLAGCGPQAICAGGEYPVLQTGGTGRQCVKDGEQPPAGFSKYPDGQVPEHVDDEWDVYWRDHTVDGSGKTVSLA